MIPSKILTAVSRAAGGGLTVILGAGCSLERPTDLKLATYYAHEGYRRLVADNRVPEDDDLDDGDLAAVASHCVSHASRDALRELLPVAPFRTAEPNGGTLTVVALMREDIVRTVVTLNLDMSPNHALAQLSSGSDIAELTPQDGFSQYGAKNLVYLHGTVAEQPDYWILTKEDLELAEASGWHQVMAVLATAAPVTLFAGMGSKANVFAQSVQWLAEKLPEGQTDVYLASLDDGPVSDFAKSLKIDDAHYIKLGWCELMQSIGHRVCQEMISNLLQAAEAVQQDPGWTHSNVNCTLLEGPLLRLGLLGLGRVRAVWLGEHSKYLPQHNLSRGELNRFAELLVVAAIVAMHLDSDPSISTFGSIDFPGRANILVRSGGGRSWTTLESQVRNEYRTAVDAHLLPRKAVLAHATNRPDETRVPTDIVEGLGHPDDIAVGDADVVFLDFDEVLIDPGRVA